MFLNLICLFYRGEKVVKRDVVIRIDCIASRVAEATLLECKDLLAEGATIAYTPVTPVEEHRRGRCDK